MSRAITPSALKLPWLLTQCLPRQKLASAEIQDVPDFLGAPDTIRTCDLCLRRATLYPAELRVRQVHLADWPGLGNGSAEAAKDKEQARKAGIARSNRVGLPKSTRRNARALSGPELGRNDHLADRPQRNSGELQMGPGEGNADDGHRKSDRGRDMSEREPPARQQ